MIRFEDSKVLLRNMARLYPEIEKAEGVYLYDKEGKRYLDAAGGALVMSVGHSHPHVVQAIQKQVQKLSYVNGTQFTADPVEKLAAKLVELAKPIGLSRVSFLSSGSEAVEAAIKFCRQLWMERGKPQKSKLIARIPSYHGNTLYALSASGRPHYKKLYGPLLSEVSVIPSPYRYRSAVADFEKDGGKYYADLVEKAILDAGPETVSAFIAEPVLGSSAGGAHPPADYFSRVSEICKKYGVLIIADEVLCGMGRTGKFFASEHFGLKPDVAVLGKGINGGYLSLSAVLTKEDQVQEMRKGSGNFQHAQTYMNHPLSCAVGLAILEVYEKEKLVSRSEKMGVRLHQKLKTELLSHPNIGHIEGIGLLAGVEFVEDKATKKPFDRSKKVAERVFAKALENGLTLWPNYGQADQVNGDLVLMGPPLTITETEINEVVSLLKKTVSEVLS